MGSSMCHADPVLLPKEKGRPGKGGLGTFCFGRALNGQLMAYFFMMAS